MPQNTSNTYLYHKATPSASAFTKLCDITSYPDIFSAPPRLQTTTLSHEQHTYIPDIKDVPDMQFGCNYELADFQRIKALEGTKLEYELRFGEDGEFGIFAWAGDVFITPTGGAVGAVRSGQITCYPETEIEFSVGA